LIYFIHNSELRAKTLQTLKIFTWLLVILGALATQAHASFVGYYSLNQFTLTNTESDGHAQTPDGGATVVITGPNDGSGNQGTTDLTIQAAANGIVTFNWSYSSLDLPQFDDAGFLLGGNFTLLADADGESGHVSFAVATGEVFGFEMASVDNQGEPGILTVSNFSVPLPVTGIPEPAPAVLLAVSGAIVAAYTSRARSVSGRESR
jgi:hypothetical protein